MDSPCSFFPSCIAESELIVVAVLVFFVCLFFVFLRNPEPQCTFEGKSSGRIYRFELECDMSQEIDFGLFVRCSIWPLTLVSLNNTKLNSQNPLNTMQVNNLGVTLYSLSTAA